ncbi:thioester domain-containing protein [Actinophytocola sp.]|uniref:thioester domain-containing protein n=1 Tax=Actinophytocola sp. TaxID=1872138 RepID=UPI002D7FEDAE|nr:thioester domain-containing protein [Actinophytocola sp.]HET9141843.1 thioester domain-containing protein [Actinophytocola sp.]
MARGFKLGVAAAALSIAGLTAAALPASAEGVVTGTVIKGAGTEGYRGNINHPHGYDPRAILFDLKLADGTVLQVYCVQIWENLDYRTDVMEERPWGSYPDPKSPFNKNSAKINWVLHNGYPARTVEQLAAKLTDLHDGLSKAEAITATQAAIWHFSDGENLDRKDVLLDTGDKGTEADVLALYDYLTGAANVGIGEPKAPSLAIKPGEKAGKSGDRIGPFTVSTNGDITDLKKTVPAGVKITDKDGVELTVDALKDGSEIYFDVPKGTATGDGVVDLTATAEVSTGRLFVGSDGKAQALIVAQSDKATVTAGAKATWTLPVVPTTTTTTPPATTAPPTTTTSPVPQAAPAAQEEELASTGASPLVPLGLGVLLLGAGAGLLLVRRRKA